MRSIEALSFRRNLDAQLRLTNTQIEMARTAFMMLFSDLIDKHSPMTSTDEFEGKNYSRRFIWLDKELEDTSYIQAELHFDKLESESTSSLDDRRLPHRSLTIEAHDYDTEDDPLDTSNDHPADFGFLTGSNYILNGETGIVLRNDMQPFDLLDNSTLSFEAKLFKLDQLINGGNPVQEDEIHALRNLLLSLEPMQAEQWQKQ